MNVQYQVAPELPNELESVRLNIGFPFVRTDGRSGGRCTVTRLPNFLGWINFLTHGAQLLPLRARESSAISVALEFVILVGRDFNG